MRLSDPQASKQRVAIDLDFEEYMDDKDIKKMAKQLQTCYAFNRRLPHPLQLHLTSLKGKCKERVESVVGNGGRWDVCFALPSEPLCARRPPTAHPTPA